MIIDRLIDRILELDNPSVVGLDTRMEYVPKYLKEEAQKKQKEPLRAASDAVYAFNAAIIDSVCDVVPAVKPQIAFYEQYGAAGIDCYIKTVRYAKSKGLFVIGDIKRGDVASTAQAYANAHLGRVTGADGNDYAVFDEDFVTLNPYLGFDAVSPFIEEARKHDKGLFILVKTSNAGSGDIQDVQTEMGMVYEAVAKKVMSWGKNDIGCHGFSMVGAVVGATHPAQASELRKMMPSAFFLVPGYGTQGGTAGDAGVCFNENGIGAIVNNSSAILAAHMKPENRGEFGESNFALAARKAALEMRDSLRKHIPRAKGK
ncbi:MAG: orotidine-5'-phosphate decarboxylase [Defluviitaleaceae bacterium]|nr:orotidine-5'-phosphate decarboxylase [Defluviitaleaceae bacterium]